jgi:hypothetical protein
MTVAAVIADPQRPPVREPDAGRALHVHDKGGYGIGQEDDWARPGTQRAVLDGAALRPIGTDALGHGKERRLELGSPLERAGELGLEIPGQETPSARGRDLESPEPTLEERPSGVTCRRSGAPCVSAGLGEPRRGRAGVAAEAPGARHEAWKVSKAAR